MGVGCDYTTSMNVLGDGRICIRIFPTLYVYVHECEEKIGYVSSSRNDRFQAPSCVNAEKHCHSIHTAACFCVMGHMQEFARLHLEHTTVQLSLLVVVCTLSVDLNSVNLVMYAYPCFEKVSLLILCSVGDSILNFWTNVCFLVYFAIHDVYLCCCTTGLCFRTQHNHTQHPVKSPSPTLVIVSMQHPACGLTATAPSTAKITDQGCVW